MSDIWLSGSDIDNRDTIYLMQDKQLNVYTDYKGECCKAAGNIFLPGCYAYSPAVKWASELDRSSFILTFDCDIVVGTDTVRAGSDLLTFPAFSVQTGFEKQELDNTIRYRLAFPDALLFSMTFGHPTPVATFNCSSTGGTAYEQSVVVVTQ